MKSVFLLLVIVALILCFKCIPQIIRNKEYQEKCKLCVGIGIFLVVVYICTNDTIEGLEAEAGDEYDVVPPVDHNTDGEPPVDDNTDDVPPADVMPPVDNGVDGDANNKNLTTNASDCPSNCNEALPCWQKPATVCGAVGAGSETGKNDCIKAGGKWCVDNPDPPKPDPHDDYPIKVVNKTGSTMYVFSISNGALYPGMPFPNNWMANKNGEQVNKTYMYIVHPNEFIGFKPKSNNNYNWSGANLIVSKNIPINKSSFTYDGMTNYEFTIQNGVVNGDISGTTGLNSFGEFKITAPDGDCNNGGVAYNICNSPDENQVSILKDTVNGIDRYSKNKLDKNEQWQKAIKNAGNQCGINGDCIGCATGDDKCGKEPPANQQTGCVSNNFKDRWGCYMWWNDTSNDSIKAWNNLFKNCSSTYSWAYDEVILHNFTEEDTYDTLLKGSCNNSRTDTCDAYVGSNIYKCQWSEQDCDKSKPYLENNEKKPLKTCIFNNFSDISIVITIESIL